MESHVGRRPGPRHRQRRMAMGEAFAGVVLASATMGGAVTAVEPAAATDPESGATMLSVTCAGPAGARVSCWPADGDAIDAVGSNDGVLQGGTTFVAFVFDGIDDVVMVAHAASIDFAPGEAMSVSFWMRRTSNATIQHMIGKRDLCVDESFNWQVAFDASSFQFGERPPNGTAVAQKPPIGTWIHVTGTQSGSKWRFYVDGDLAATKVGRLGPTNGVALLMGRAGLTCQPYGGALDEVQIWARALTDDQVAQTYRANAVCSAKPAAPASLSPAPDQRVSTRRPTLDWTARGCATRYSVVVRRGSSTGPVVVSRSGLTRSSFTTPTLAAGRTWAWRATACDAYGCRAGTWRTFRTPA